MCEYSFENKCKLTNGTCPYVYFCNKTMTWKESNSMPLECKVKAQNVQKQNGKYLVAFEKRGYLYINIDGNIEVIKSPYKTGEAPNYVKAQKNKQGKWFIKK